MARRPNGTPATEGRKTVAQRREEAHKALTLRVAGHTDHEIATELQVSLSQVNRLISKGIRDLHAASAESMRAVEEIRLGLLYGETGSIIKDPNVSAETRLKAIGEARRIGESYRRLMGIDLDSRVITELLAKKALEAGGGRV